MNINQCINVTGSAKFPGAQVLIFEDVCNYKNNIINFKFLTCWDKTNFFMLQSSTRNLFINQSDYYKRKKIGDETDFEMKYKEIINKKKIENKKFNTFFSRERQ